jgi:hypothetical protein
MRISGRGVVMVAVLAVLAAGVTASADNNPAGMAFRAVNFVKGKADVTEDKITCEIPVVGEGIADGAFAMGIWNTFGFANLYFPDPNSPFTNPCGGWLQLQSNLVDQSLVVERVELRFKIPGAGRFRQFVPTKNGFPIACRQFRKDTLFVGTVINASNSTDEGTSSGKPNVAFLQLLPMVSTQLFNCLRGQYGSLSTDIYSSLSLVIRVTAFGVSDSGDQFKSNTLPYTLNLRHTCGNGRVDDGEFCDPGEPNPCAHGVCVNGTCSLDTQKLCNVDADCNGTCTSSAVPEECTCLY